MPFELFVIWTSTLFLINFSVAADIFVKGSAVAAFLRETGTGTSWKDFRGKIVLVVSHFLDFVQGGGGHYRAHRFIKAVCYEAGGEKFEVWTLAFKSFTFYVDHLVK